MGGGTARRRSFGGCVFLLSLAGWRLAVMIGAIPFWVVVQAVWNGKRVHPLRNCSGVH